MITKYERPVARLIPEGGRDLAKVRQAVAGLCRLRAQIAKRPGFRPLTDKEIKDAINAGRP